jgi:hypothetical protein
MEVLETQAGGVDDVEEREDLKCFERHDLILLIQSHES